MIDVDKITKKEYIMKHEIIELDHEELESINGGLGPVGAYAIVTGLGALFVASYAIGYQFGKDLAE